MEWNPLDWLRNRYSGRYPGGNYGNPINQHPLGREGIAGDIRNGTAAEHVRKTALQGGYDYRPPVPSYGGTNKQMRQWYEENPWALGR